MKVFVSGRAQDTLGSKYDVIERYPAFVVVSASEAGARELAKSNLVEDISDQYAIPLGGAVQATLDVSKPRITTRGTTAPHPDYRGARRLSAGPHHYLVQFVGPVKPEWLDAVRAAGGDARFHIFARGRQYRYAVGPHFRRHAAPRGNVPQVAE